MIELSIGLIGLYDAKKEQDTNIDVEEAKEVIQRSLLTLGITSLIMGIAGVVSPFISTVDSFLVFEVVCLIESFILFVVVYIFKTAPKFVD